MTINIKKSNKGLLHKNLGIPAGKSIPATRLEKAANSSSPAIRKRAVFAMNAKKFNHNPDPGQVNLPKAHDSSHN